MIEEPRLFRLAPAALHAQATYEPGKGWRLTVGMRRQDETWSDVERAEYSHLSTQELLDVWCEEAARLL